MMLMTNTGQTAWVKWLTLKEMAVMPSGLAPTPLSISSTWGTIFTWETMKAPIRTQMMHARGDGGLLELLREKQFALQAGGERLERVVELAGIRAGLDQADDGFAEAAGAAERLMHVDAGVDVLADARQGIHHRFVRQAVAVVFEGVGGVDLGAQHRAEAAEHVHEFLLFELLDFLRLVEGGEQALWPLARLGAARLAAGLSAVAVALVIGVGHVDDLADGGKVGFAFAQQAQAAAAEIGEDAFLGDFDFQFVGSHFAFGEQVGDFRGDRDDFEDGGAAAVAGVAAFLAAAGFGDEERDVGPGVIEAEGLAVEFGDARGGLPCNTGRAF